MMWKGIIVQNRLFIELEFVEKGLYCCCLRMIPGPLVIVFELGASTFVYNGDGASWSIVVEEGEPVDAAGSGATTSAIRAITSGAERSTLDGGLSNSSNNG
ncbi:hypothetical protein Tco_0677089 [Tanacetum coccineum]